MRQIRHVCSATLSGPPAEVRPLRGAVFSRSAARKNFRTALRSDDCIRESSIAAYRAASVAPRSACRALTLSEFLIALGCIWSR